MGRVARQATPLDVALDPVVMRRRAATLRAQEHLEPYAKLMMPDPEHPDDPALSKYLVGPHSRLMFEATEKVADAVLHARRDGLTRLAVSIGPQFGKSQIISRFFPAWLSGRDPTLNIMLGTYNQDRANEEGDEVRALIGSRAHQQVFPGHGFRKAAEAKNYMVTNKGGRLAFVGVGGSGSGKPADVFIIDDPYRNDEDARSDIYRENVWQWFNKVALARAVARTVFVVVHTRWHEDDLIGRLCDPDHPERHKKYKGIADRWQYINLPAVVDGPNLAQALGLKLEVQTDPLVVEQFGSKPIAPLFAERKPLHLLAEAKQTDAMAFSSLYMGKPTPDDGFYFHVGDLVEYEAHELPKNLVKYGASDHAVTEKQTNDPNVIGCVGVDEHDDIWVLPDIVWDRMETDAVVEAMLDQMRRHKPGIWWMESELISKSFGPFLKKRMVETRTYVTLDPVVPSKDKQARARSAQGRMRMRKIRFPRFAPWWPAAKAQLLRFPYGTHDDFVDWLAHIGQGLTKERAAEPEKFDAKVVPFRPTLAWVKRDSAFRQREAERRKKLAGF